MSEIVVELRAAFVGCLEPELNSEINFNLINSSDKIEILNDSENIYKIRIKDSSDIGYNPAKIQRENLSRLIAISCSLACNKVVFSPKNKPKSLISEIKKSEGDKDEDEPKITTTKEENGSETISVEIPTLTLGFRVSIEATVCADADFDESKFLDIAKNLLDYNIFETKTDRVESNINESFKEYEFALNSEHRYTCFKHLFCSLEKMINRDTEYRGSDFDNEITKITNNNVSENEKFRRCYNRQKHTADNETQKNQLKRCIENIPRMIPKLKKIVDEVIY